MATILLVLMPLPARAQQEDDTPSPDEKALRRPFMVDSHHKRIWQMHRGGYLGVHLLDLTPELRAHFGVDESTGVMVASVAEGSPAADAGLEVGDIVTSIDGQAVTDRFRLARQVGVHEKGETVEIEVYRDGGFETRHATLDERRRPQLWLNSLDDDHGFTMEWQTDDDGMVVLPSPGGSRMKIKGEQLDQVMGHLHERLASPDFKARMFEFRSNTEELERRIKELEERLLELSKKLEELTD